MWRGRVACALTIAGCGSNVAPSPVRPPEPTSPPVAATSAPVASPALPEGIHRLDGDAFDLPSRDLAPLAKMIGERRFVGLGESIHASAGYYRMKARIMRSLVEEHGFRVLAIETPVFEAMTATRYLERCEGSPVDAVRGVVPVFHDMSLATFLGWACQWNQAHPGDRVAVWGFDTQEPWQDMAILGAYVAAVDGTHVSALKKDVGDCVGAQATGSGIAAGKAFWNSPDGQIWIGKVPYPEDRHRRCVAGLARVRAWMKALPEKSRARVPERDQTLADVALLAFEGLQAQALGDAHATKGVSARDENMGRIFQTMESRLFPGKKTMIWAHNDHLAIAPETMIGKGTEGAMLGKVLHDLYGDAYFPVALTGYRVKVDWGKFSQEDPMIPTWEGDFETHLHALGAPFLLVDLDAMTSAKSLWATTGSRRIAWLECVPRAQFGAAIYLDDSPKLDRIPPP